MISGRINRIWDRVIITVLIRNLAWNYFCRISHVDILESIQLYWFDLWRAWCNTRVCNYFSAHQKLGMELLLWPAWYNKSFSNKRVCWKIYDLKKKLSISYDFREVNSALQYSSFVAHCSYIPITSRVNLMNAWNIKRNRQLYERLHKLYDVVQINKDRSWKNPGSNKISQ